MTQQRVAPGVPTGGQFSGTTHDETGLSLTPSGVRPTKIVSGLWRLQENDTPEDAALRSRLLAVGTVVTDSTQQDAVDSKLRHLCDNGSQMTVLTQTSRGGGTIIMEGVGAYTDAGKLAIIPEGHQRTVTLGDDLKPLDVAEGIGKVDVLAESYLHAAAQVPELDRVTSFADDLPHFTYDDGAEEPPEAISAVYLYRPRNPDNLNERIPGCLFLATDYTPEIDIVNGYMWAPRGSGFESEHGSMLGNELKAVGGRIRDYEPGALTFGDCINGLGEDRSTAYLAVTGKDT